jgi:hypothetical protein
MLNKTPLLVGILFLCIILGTAKTAEAAVTSGAIKAVTSASTQPCTLAVVFENGYNTINKTASTNFTVSIKIYNPPEGIGQFCVGLKWDPSALALKTGTSADVVEGTWMPHFGATIYSVGAINNTGGTINQISDALTTYLPGATGAGTMFTVAFHAQALSPVANITIRSPNTATTYLLNASLDGVVNIDAVVDGSVIVIPEFSASALLPLFLVATTIAIAAATVSSRKRRIPFRLS